jgi:Ca-activated chloride channel family protein
MHNGKTFLLLGSAAVLVLALILGGAHTSKEPGVLSTAQAAERLEQLYRGISVHTAAPVKGRVDMSEDVIKALLPNISKYPVQVESVTEEYVEIFASSEKSGVGTDGWLVKVAEAFNSAGHQVNGKPVSVRIRGIASGLGVDYIASGKYRPEAFSPSNELWGEVLKAKGVPVSLVEKRLVGNVAGVLLSMEKHRDLIEKYGEIDLKAIIDAVQSNIVAMGYTNPFASSTGLNFLVTTLYTFDINNPLSVRAVNAFEQFQTNISLVAYSTLQLRDAARRGALDGFILEYQSYANMPDIHANYMFTAFGVRHDSPLYAIGNLSATKEEILKQFAAYCKSSQSQQLGRDYGFNARENYRFNPGVLPGDILVQAQKLWKDKKNGADGLMAVFVADASSSMAGQRLDKLKESLVKASININKETALGLVTFSDDVSIALPIGKFNLDQRSMFSGTLQSMQASGGSAMYDAIAVGAKLLVDAKASHPDARLMLLVLTSGVSNRGLSYSEIKEVLAGLKIPVYTVGYEANLATLRQLSELNGAATINADTSDVGYKLEDFFNAEM